MLVSLNWLQDFFVEPLPEAKMIEDALTFHSCEVEAVIKVKDDTVFDVKVLPDKSAWLLSHRGVAKELAAILNLTLKSDPLKEIGQWKANGKLKVELSSSACDHYEALLIKGVKIGPSPAWLKDYLEALGQRSINNVVDITNYVMLQVGQPLHAFDADKLKEVGGLIRIGTRLARVNETIKTLSDEEKVLTETDTVITDLNSDTVLAIGGVKGGQAALVEESTTRIVLESAHFERRAIRQTARRLDLLTDAAKRFENGAPRQLVRPALTLAAKLITELASGEVIDFSAMEKSSLPESRAVTVSLNKVNSCLGLKLTVPDIEAVWQRFGYLYGVENETFIVTPPPERDDINIAEDLVEEVGRLVGLDKIESIPPGKVPFTKVNKRHYYATKVREVLLKQGFSEVITSSFRDNDEVKLKNALASDKGCLRSSLLKNLAEARDRNLPHRDLLGISAVKLFEIGTTFGIDSEQVKLAIAVRSGTAYKAKLDEPILKEAVAAIESVLEKDLLWVNGDPGVCEFNFDLSLEKLPEPTEAKLPQKVRESVNYQPFSIYPSVSRDVAFWVSDELDNTKIGELLKIAAGNLCVRLTHLDTFSKEGQTSVAYRLVLQAPDRTLGGAEVDMIMNQVYEAIKKSGYTPR